MLNLTKVGMAVTLGLALCLSLFTSGAFAKSISQNGALGAGMPTNQVLQGAWNGGYPGARLGNHVPGNGWRGNGCQRDGWQENGWCVFHINCPEHGKYSKYTHRTKQIKFWRYGRRAAYQACRGR